MSLESYGRVVIRGHFNRIRIQSTGATFPHGDHSSVESDALSSESSGMPESNCHRVVVWIRSRNDAAY
jgi:hypothetical protein